MHRDELALLEGIRKSISEIKMGKFVSVVLSNYICMKKQVYNFRLQQFSGKIGTNSRVVFTLDSLNNI